MSTATLTPRAGDSGDDWDDFLRFEAIVRDFDLAEFDGEPRTVHRPARGADKRAAIDKSLRGEA